MPTPNDMPKRMPKRTWSPPVKTDTPPALTAMQLAFQQTHNRKESSR